MSKYLILPYCRGPQYSWELSFLEGLCDLVCRIRKVSWVGKRPSLLVAGGPATWPNRLGLLKHEFTPGAVALLNLIYKPAEPLVVGLWWILKEILGSNKLSGWLLPPYWDDNRGSHRPQSEASPPFPIPSRSCVWGKGRRCFSFTLFLIVGNLGVLSSLPFLKFWGACKAWGIHEYS